jgi:MraZ protein
VRLLRPFVSTFVNRVDAKGRVSVPARFREILDAQGSRTIFARASTVAPSIMVGGADFMAATYEMIDQHDPTSEAHDDFAYALLGDTVELSLDSEGRVAFPERLMRHAAIDDAAGFIGVGGHFEVWEPKALEVRTLEARRNAKEKRGTLRVVKTSGGNS